MSAAHSETLALAGGTVYPSPGEPAIRNGVVIVRDGKIVAVGKKGSIRLPPSGAILDCSGLAITAGFWNSHVHFGDPKWVNAASLPAAQLTAQMQAMLTRYGFTTVVDAGSFLAPTLALRARVESGEVAGPKIYTAGEPLYPKDGLPIYVREALPPSMLALLPQPATAEQAVEIVRQHFAGGADLIKIFAGSWLGDDKTAAMPLSIIRAVTAEAHRQNRLVFAHPQTEAGVEAAVSGNVDVLVHTAPAAGSWSQALLEKMKARGVALVPTLKLWEYEAAREGLGSAPAAEFVAAGVAQLRAYSRAGGQILFGTDVGYMADYDPTDEYLLMSRAGMSFPQILASLTTAPAERFHRPMETGQIAEGREADVVVLEGDPADDVRALARVRYTLRGGKVIYGLSGYNPPAFSGDGGSR